MLSVRGIGVAEREMCIRDSDKAQQRQRQSDKQDHGGDRFFSQIHVRSLLQTLFSNRPSNKQLYPAV